MDRVLLIVLIGLGCAQERSTSAPLPEQPAVVEAASNLLVESRGSAGWEFRLGAADHTAATSGLIGLGLLSAYDRTQRSSYFDAAGIAADLLLDSFHGEAGMRRPYSQTVEFLAQSGHMKEAERWFARTLEKYPVAATYADFIIDGRNGMRMGGMAGWDIASAVRAALAVGEVEYANGLLGRTLERYGDWDHSDAGGTYMLMSYGSLLWSLGWYEEKVGELPDHLGELATTYRDTLLSYQLPGGGFALTFEDYETVDVQTTAYAALGLWYAPNAEGREVSDAARNARDWLVLAAFEDASIVEGCMAWAPSHLRADAGPELPIEIQPGVMAEALLAVLTVE